MIDFQALWPPIKLFILHTSFGALIAFPVLSMLERFIPAQPFDAKGFLISARASIIYTLFAPFAAAVPIYLVSHFTSQFHFQIKINMLLHAYMFPDWAWLIAFLPVPFFIYDFFYYWFHRLQHSSFLWEQHKLHHSDQHFSVATGLRHHWLEDALRAFLLLLPMGLIFKITPFQSYLLNVILLQWGFLLHANIKLNFGLLEKVFSGPQYHRIHHSIEPQHHDKNFAAFFPIWDVLFGTYYKPAKDEYPDTGVAGQESNLSLTETFMLPFYSWFKTSLSRKRGSFQS